MRMAAVTRQLVVFPTLVVALLPVVSVVLGNSALLEVNSSLTRRPTAVLLGVALGLTVVLRCVTSELRVRAAGVSIWLLTLWLYPALYRWVWPLNAVSEGVAATAYLVAASALALWLAPRMGRPENQLLVNGLAIGVVVATSVRLAVMTHMWETPPWSASVDRILGVHERSLLLSEQAPDIYYIVLDGMSRLDTLRGVYGIDVGAFAYGLAARGFSVAAQSSSNYSQTHLSLASALNMTYLDDLAHSMGDSADRTPLRILVQRSRAISRLRDAGYEFVMIGSDYSLTITHPQADRCDCALVSGLSELESALIDRSPFRVLSLENHTFGAHSRKVLHSFDSIAALRRGTRPMLVFAHILSPHPPFVLNKDGRA